VRHAITCTLVTLAFALAAQADPIKFARYPNAANDGRIAFSYHGDVWVAEADGSAPRRLTAHIARDEHPRFSPDGRWIAFTSNRMGNDDVWLIPAGGGEPRQLTLHSTGDTGLGWTPDGRGVLIATSRGAAPWGSPLHVAPLDGGIPRPLAMDRGSAGMIRQDGAMVAFNRIGTRYWRKGYRGNNNTDIYLQPTAGGEIRQLTDLDVKQFRTHTQDAWPMWGADGMIYFLSERDGIFNIWRIGPDGGAPEQVTRHETDGVQYPSISPDGTIIVYENEFELWRVDVPDGEPRTITVELAFDPKDNLVDYLDVENEMDGFSPSPDGERVAVDYHGEIFIVPSEPELGEKTQVTDSAWRDRYQEWSPDGGAIAYISDESGDEEIWVYDVETAQHRQLTTHESVKRTMVWSSDGSRIAFEADNRLFLVEVDSGKRTELAHNPEGGYSVRAFSRDGHWLVYSRSNSDLNAEVYLFDIEQRVEHNVTRNPFNDFGGLLTPDGSTLLFTSSREGGTYHLFAVSLTRMTEDPEDPLVRARHAKAGKERGARSPRRDDGEDDEKETDGPGEDEDGESPEEEPRPSLTIDLDGIDRRPRRLSEGDDRVTAYFVSADGRKVYYVQGGDLHVVGLDGRDRKKVSDGPLGRLTMSADGKWFFFQSRDGLSRIPVSGGKKEPVRFAFRVRVDHRAEWEQVFEEAWRVMKYRFYDEDMHGVDWDGMKARYKPLLAYVGENEDLYDLCNEMIGELNASHTGVSGPPTRSMERMYSTMHLGFEMAEDGGHYRVTHVYPKGPADKEWLGLEIGDVILSIDGNALETGRNYCGLLSHLLNEYVDVEVATPMTGDDDGSTVLGDPRTLRIRPVGSVRNIQYEAWVESRRALVDEWSGGKVGYVHIRSMNQSSLRRFETEIDQFWNKNGMIIDIRYNGGGNIDQQLIDILERRPYEYWNYRMGGRAAGRRPRQAIAGPKVMLINWRSPSHSEVTPQGFRDLELGRIVGNPTYGAVIATGSYRLLNGGRIRTPGSLVVTYDPTKPNNYGINLENFGVAPDVWVENTPQDELDGFDRELKAAVDEALRMLAEGTWQYGEDD
jgi:tricorn protease